MRAITLRRASTAGYAALPGRPTPSASTMRGHRGGRAHHHAVAVRAVHAALGLVELVLRDLAGAQVLGERPGVGARADALALVPAREHRAAGDADGGQVHARSAHQQRGRGLVAAHEQHHAVDADCRGSTPRRPCWRGCDRASRWAAAASRPATSPGTRAGSRPPPSTPAFTCSASVRKCELQGVSSE